MDRRPITYKLSNSDRRLSGWLLYTFRTETHDKDVVHWAYVETITGDITPVLLSRIQFSDFEDEHLKSDSFDGHINLPEFAISTMQRVQLNNNLIDWAGIKDNFIQTWQIGRIALVLQQEAIKDVLKRLPQFQGPEADEQIAKFLTYAGYQRSDNGDTAVRHGETDNTRCQGSIDFDVLKRMK